jgi:hypothetical protein
MFRQYIIDHMEVLEIRKKGLDLKPDERLIKLRNPVNKKTIWVKMTQEDFDKRKIEAVLN